MVLSISRRVVARVSKPWEEAVEGSGNPWSTESGCALCLVWIYERTCVVFVGEGAGFVAAFVQGGVERIVARELSVCGSFEVVYKTMKEVDVNNHMDRL
jgi:hypothetical protein